MSLRRLWETGRAAWPALDVPAEAFVTWLEARLEPEMDPAALVAADLYLVAACLMDIPGAAQAFVTGPLAVAARHAERIVKTPEARDELMQELAVALLTPGPDGTPARLAQYSGRGPLAVWLRMAVTRRALNAVRGAHRTLDFEEVALDKASEADPELSVLRRRHRQEISDIFREAVAATSLEDRTLLRLHYVQGSTLNELAALHRLSRSGMHRRIDAARDALMERIGELVRDRLRVTVSQQGSMLRIFRSDLRAQLGQLLRDPPAQ